MGGDDLLDDVLVAQVPGDLLDGVALGGELLVCGVELLGTAGGDGEGVALAAEEMIRPEDVAESVRYLLRTSPACVIPEIIFQRPGDAL